MLPSTEAQPQSTKKLDAHMVDFNKPLTEETQNESMVFQVPCHSCGKTGE